MGDNDSSDRDAVDAAIAEMTPPAVDAVLGLAVDAVAGGLSAAAEAAPRGAVSAAFSGVRGAVRAVMPSADEQFAKATTEAITDYAFRVPVLEQDIRAIAQSVRDHHEANRRERDRSFGDEVARLVANRVVSIEDVQSSPHLRDAIARSYRHAANAISPDVIPALARLAAKYRDRPFDRLGRAMGRALEELSSDQWPQLVALVELAVGHADSHVDISRHNGGDMIRLIAEGKVRAQLEDVETIETMVEHGVFWGMQARAPMVARIPFGHIPFLAEIVLGKQDAGR